MKYTRLTPCAQCPFRSDIEPFLRYDRVRELEAHQDGEFPCHQTTTFEDDGEEEVRVSRHLEVACAGRMIMSMKEQKGLGTVDRLSTYLFNPEDLDLEAPVFDSWDDMADAQED